MTIEMLYEILLSDKPSEYLKKYEDDLFLFIPELRKCKNFDQKSDWHIFDVYNHILNVVDNTDCNLPLRLAALFHDVGKPYVYSVDELGKGHFYNHWMISKDIFDDFARNNNINYILSSLTSKLIEYHDLNLLETDKYDLDEFLYSFDNNELDLLFNLKRSDLLAQNPKYRYYMDVIDNQERFVKNLTRSKKVL